LRSHEAANAPALRRDGLRGVSIRDGGRGAGAVVAFKPRRRGPCDRAISLRAEVEDAMRKFKVEAVSECPSDWDTGKVEAFVVRQMLSSQTEIGTLRVSQEKRVQPIADISTLSGAIPDEDVDEFVAGGKS
jgi:hypothetical protein